MSTTRQERYELIYGNTARQMEAAPVQPEYEPKRKPRPKRRPNTEPRPDTQVRKNQERVLEFDFAFVRMLVAALAVVVAVSFFYLSERSKVLNQRSVVAEKKDLLNTLQVENEDLNLEIEQSINLASIEAAAKKYGMKKPSSGQVLYYDSTDADYVRQYSQIPEAD